jgi:hypothetical protein
VKLLLIIVGVPSCSATRNALASDRLSSFNGLYASYLEGIHACYLMLIKSTLYFVLINFIPTYPCVLDEYLFIKPFWAIANILIIWFLKFFQN